MKRFIFKILFSLSSFNWILIFFLINQRSIPYINLWITQNLLWIKYIIIFIIPFTFAYWVLYFSHKSLWSSETLQLIDNKDVNKKSWEIKPAEGIFLPVYIWLFVVALELGDPFNLEVWILLSFLFILRCFFEWVSYFNPFFLFFGYRFYEIKDINNISFMLITDRKDIKKLRNFDNLTRINNFTFLEYKSYE